MAPLATSHQLYEELPLNYLGIYSPTGETASINYIESAVMQVDYGSGFFALYDYAVDPNFYNIGGPVVTDEGVALGIAISGGPNLY